MKYVLKEPITVGETTVTELIFREKICAGDLRGLPMREPPHFDDMIKIAGRLCGQPDPVIFKLTGDDIGEVIGIVSGFMGAGAETGKTP